MRSADAIFSETTFDDDDSHCQLVQELQRVQQKAYKFKCSNDGQANGFPVSQKESGYI
jgi:hypothetical protein